MEVATLSVEQVFQALESCMKVNPTEGRELRLHPDANAIAGVWAELHIARRPSIAVNEIKPRALEAIERWARPD